MRKLIQELVHPLLDLGPVLHPAMHLEDILAHPAPQLLNRVEPRGIGGQPHRFEPRVARQSSQHIGVGVNVPVVLADVEGVRQRLGALKRGGELTSRLAADAVALHVVHLPRHGMEGSERTPWWSVARPLCHRCLPPPGGGDLGPTPIPQFIPDQRHHRVRVARGVAQTAGHPPHLAAIVGSGAAQSAHDAGIPSPHAGSTRHTPLTVNPVSHSTDTRRVPSVQRLGAGPLSAPATSRPAASPGPARRVSRRSSCTAACSAQRPPTLPTMWMGQKSGYALVLIDL